MAVLALMALALARPRLYSQMPLGDQSVPTALGLVFDTSLSMEYKEKDKTRLDEAKERALAILDKIPDSSLVFLVNSADPVACLRSDAGRGPPMDRRSDHPPRESAARIPPWGRFIRKSPSATGRVMRCTC